MVHIIFNTLKIAFKETGFLQGSSSGKPSAMADCSTR